MRLSLPKLHLVWLFLLGLMGGLGFSGTGERAVLNRGAVRFYTDREGLPHNTIWAMAQDQDGMVWAGTLNGIARYDGRGWAAMPIPVASAGVLVNPNAMTCLRDGSLCFGTRNQGLLVFKAGAWSRYGRAEGLGSDNVNAVLESRSLGRDGRPLLWVGTFGGGMVKFEEGKWVQQPIGKVPGTERVYALMEVPDARGNPELWAGTQQGVWIRDAKGWRPFAENEQLPGKRVRALAWARAGQDETIWMGLDEGGIAAWNGRALQLHGPGNGLPKGPVHALLARQIQGEDPILWATVGDESPVFFQRGHWSSEGLGTQPELRYARSLLSRGKAGSPPILWVGTEGKGVARCFEGGWQHLSFPGQETDPRVLRILPGKESRGSSLWFGTQSGGVWRLEQGRWTHWTTAQGLPSNTVRDLAWVHFAGQEFLIAATNEGLAQWSGGRWKPLLRGTHNALSRSLLFREGRAGNRLWVATSQGLQAWDGSGWKTYGAESGLSDLSVRCLEGRSDGDGGAEDGIFVGTDSGLFGLNKGHFDSIPLPKTMLNAGVSALKWGTDSKGEKALWIGTYGAGVALLRPRESGWISQAVPTGEPSPLGGEVVLSLQQDLRGRLYAGTLQGILRIQFLPGGQVVQERFGEEDGLPSRECLQGKGTCESAGRVWMGTAGGAVCLDPAREFMDREPKPLRLLGAFSELLPGGLSENQSVPSGSERLRFEYALIAHHRENDSRYRTQLEGLESSPTAWVQEGQREFTGLPHGKYVFRVWGKDYAGNLSGPVVFPFSIAPPVWATWWARSLELLGLLAAIWGAFRWRSARIISTNRALEAQVAIRTREVREQKEALERLTEDLVNLDIQKSQFLGMVAHDLRNPLGQISLSAELALELEDPERTQQTLQRIRGVTGHMEELIASLLTKDALENGRLSLRCGVIALAPILGDSVEGFKERADQKGQRVILAIQEDLTAWVDAERLREVLDNLISNALKYAPPGTPVEVTATGDATRVSIQVADHGQGIPKEEQGLLFQAHAKLSPRPTGGESSTGLGLCIAKQLMEAMGGSIRMETGPGGGSVFMVEMGRAARGKEGG